MAAMSAARAGAGYVTVATSASVVPALQAKLLEVMVAALPETDEGAGPQVVAALERMERVDSVVLGPGLGRDDRARTFARGVLEKAPRPLVLDADGLGALAGAVERVAVRGHPTVLTPHTGELARLLESDSDAIDARRLANAREAADRSRGIVVLKGDDTIIVEPGTRTGGRTRTAVLAGSRSARAARRRSPPPERATSSPGCSGRSWQRGWSRSPPPARRSTFMSQRDAWLPLTSEVSTG